MKKTIGLLITLMAVLALTSFVMAGDFQIEYEGSKIFTVATSGNVNISGDLNVTGTIAEQGILLSNIYWAIADVATPSDGDSTHLSTADQIFDWVTGLGYLASETDPLWTGNQSSYSTTATILGWNYYNSSDFDIANYFTSTQVLGFDYYNSTTFDYTDYYLKNNPFSFVNVTTASSLNNLITIAGENVTSGTIAFARLPSLVNKTTLSYHNITDIPTCGAGEHLDFDGATLSCTADAGGDFTNVAYYNVTNTWAEDQVFSKDLNITGDIRFMTNDTTISRNGTGTNITIDSSGNIIISLG